jgi:hypothetical protein
MTASGSGGELELAVDPGADDVGAGLLADVRLADARPDEATPAVNGELGHLHVPAEADGVGQLRAERRDGLLREPVTEHPVRGEHGVRAGVVQDVAHPAVVGERDDVDVRAHRSDRQDGVHVRVAGVRDDGPRGVDARALERRRVLWRAVDGGVPLVGEGLRVLLVGGDEHVLDTEFGELLEEHRRIAAVLADDDVVPLRGEPVVEVDFRVGEQRDDDEPEREEADPDAGDLCAGHEQVHQRMAPQPRVLPVAGRRHRLDDELEGGEDRLVDPLQPRQHDVVRDGVQQHERGERGEVVDDETVAPREVDRPEPLGKSHRGASTVGRRDGKKTPGEAVGGRASRPPVHGS